MTNTFHSKQHVYPTNDLKPHDTESGQCRCNPQSDDFVVIHNSLAYNIGVGAFCQSTVVRRFNAGDKVGACDAFLMWNRAGGKVVQGLVNRRQKEREMCLEDY